MLESNEQNNQDHGSQIRQWVFSIFINLTILSYGMQSGWMSPTIKILQSDNSPSGYPLNDYEISWIASTLCIFGMVSSFTYSYIADNFGRKVALIATIIPQGLAWGIKLISAHPISLVVARALCGLGGAGCFSVAPLYMKEITDDNIRGVVGTIGLSLQSLGTLIMYALGAYLNYYLVLAIVIWIPVINLLLILKAPESPAYLIKIGKIEAAIEVVAQLRGVNKEEKHVIADVTQMENESTYYKSIPKISIKHIMYDKAWRKAVGLSFLLLFTLDLGGSFAILTYASVIMTASGVTISPELQSLSFPAVMIVGSVVSVICIEKFGRKPLIMTCLLLCGLSLSILATVLLIQNEGGIVHPMIPVLSIIICVFCYGAGLLPVPYIVVAEIFNFQIRAKVLGFLVAFGWLLCFIQLITFAPISQTLGMHTMFYIYSGINMISIVLLYFFLPETKGKSVSEIENILRGKSK